MKKKKLSNSEELLLHIFWQAGTPLTSLDIFEISQKSPDTSSWSINYIHKMLSMLQEKELLEISGFVKAGKKYARQFLPCLSKEEYIADMLDQQGINTVSFAKIAMALVKKEDKKQTDEINDRFIEELEQMIAEFEKSGDKHK